MHPTRVAVLWIPIYFGGVVGYQGYIRLSVTAGTSSHLGSFGSGGPSSGRESLLFDLGGVMMYV